MAINGKRILVTRSAEQAPALSEALLERGAIPVTVPTIEIVPPTSYEELDQSIAGLADTDYLVLTSVNAVRAFCERLQALKIDRQLLRNVTTVAVGPKSAQALADYGLKADLVPEDYRAEGVVTLLSAEVAGKRILYPKAALARDLIPEAFGKAGAEVVAPVAYGSALPDKAPSLLQQAFEQGLDMLTFTASSTVDNLVRLLDPAGLNKALKVPVASIGPLTTTTAEKYGFTVVVEPDHSTLDALVEAIANYYSEA